MQAIKITMYGIPNCDTVKKARKFLDNAGVKYEFVNFKKNPPTINLIKSWQRTKLKDSLVNTRGPTYRRIKSEFEGANESEKILLLIENSSALKRPLIEVNDSLFAVGYNQENYASLAKLG